MATDMRILDANESAYVFAHLEKISLTLEFLASYLELANGSNADDPMTYFDAIREILIGQSNSAYAMSLLLKPDKDIIAANELIKEIEIMNTTFRQAH